jgi:hypothetical protein
MRLSAPRSLVVKRGIPMLSRAVLVIAFSVAIGAPSASAGAESQVLAVTLDQAKIARLPPGTATLIIGIAIAPYA